MRLPSGRTAWLVTRYADIRQVLDDYRFSRAEAVDPPPPGATPDVLIRSSPDVLINMDPPRHTSVRRQITGDLPPTARRAEPDITTEVDRLLDELAEHGPPADFVARFAVSLPTTAICALLGVPRADHGLFHQWAAARYFAADASAEFRELDAYLRAAARRPHRGGLIGAIASLGARPTEEELVGNLLAFVIAGHNNLATLLGTTVLALCRLPERLDRLAREPALAPAATEELLRHTRFQNLNFARTARADVCLGGRLIRRGETVITHIDSGDRDPEVHWDPDAVDFDRSDPVPTLKFGNGVHRCPGADLSRYCLTATFARLPARFPGLRLAVPESELVWKPADQLHALVGLPVTW
ncbi:cytochrome P450 [Allokutzneria albata]|uniref:cytochrome P450 n=1 Tax=Allokutzneria albata TaxID=211114 RepID=UPI000B306330|nr:cytochrome P450 [Allokutzneria albata]